MNKSVQVQQISNGYIVTAPNTGPSASGGAATTQTYVYDLNTLNTLLTAIFTAVA